MSDEEKLGSSMNYTATDADEQRPEEAVSDNIPAKSPHLSKFEKEELSNGVKIGSWVRVINKNSKKFFNNIAQCRGLHVRNGVLFLRLDVYIQDDDGQVSLHETSMKRDGCALLSDQESEEAKAWIVQVNVKKATTQSKSEVFSPSESLRMNRWIRILNPQSKKYNNAVARRYGTPAGKYVRIYAYTEDESGVLQPHDTTIRSDGKWENLSRTEIDEVQRLLGDRFPTKEQDFDLMEVQPLPLQSDDPDVEASDKEGEGPIDETSAKKTHIDPSKLVRDDSGDVHDVKRNQWIRITSQKSTKYFDHIARVRKLKNRNSSTYVCCDVYVEDDDGTIRTHDTTLVRGWVKLSDEEVLEVQKWLSTHKIIPHYFQKGQKRKLDEVDGAPGPASAISVKIDDDDDDDDEDD